MLTVLDVADLDLLQDLGPDGGVDLLVAVDELGFETHDLGDAAARVPLPGRVLPRQAHGLPPRPAAAAAAAAFGVGGRLLRLLGGRRRGPQLAHDGGDCGGAGGQELAPRSILPGFLSMCLFVLAVCTPSLCSLYSGSTRKETVDTITRGVFRAMRRGVDIA